MDKYLEEKLISIAKERISNEDPSHDIEHSFRVLNNAKRIAFEEKADLDIIIPAALFHDLIVYPKNDPNKHLSQEESAEATEKILSSIKEYPKEKIGGVKISIMECSFTKGIKPVLLESKILQDADGLEATGAISIMRTFSSTGRMKRLFYNPSDPFCKNREPESLNYALDLFFTRLLKVKERMHTETAKKIAEKRTEFLKEFLKELELEIGQ
ncbi:MAG: HD domain-containing protein [Nanoarchaeota archaeon]|nr:HD domain-containing protein [Nanoarchaeota archaeon]